MPVKRREGPTKQRQITLRRSIDPLPLLAAPEPTKLQERRASEGKSKRPPRWRGPQYNNTGNMQQRASSVVLPESNMNPARDVQRSPSRQPSQSQNIQLRFSFSQSFIDDVERQLHSKNEARFNQSFSGLSMAPKPTQSFSSSSPSSHSTEKASPVQYVSSQRSIYEEEEVKAPVLTKPGQKKKEGYGFSYSETFMYDSDDYPDTECEWDPDAEEDQGQETEPNTPTTPTSFSNTEYLNWDSGEEVSRMDEVQHVQYPQPTQQPTPRQSFSSSTTNAPSFDDLVVLRDVGSFHLARPQRHLSCTHASREDTIQLKARAQALLSKYTESASIQLSLLTRLERMLYLEQRRPDATEDSVTRALLPCAERLERWLVGSREERVATGEWKGVVEHEIEWVGWMVEAGRRGVLHVRRRGCRCRPEWEGV